MSDEDRNPLAVGVFCPVCETRIDDQDFAGGRRVNPCPVCGEDE